MSQFDLIVRNGTIVDGTGAEPFQADIGVKGGVITGLAANLAGQADKEIDATNKTVTPGFIDVHTHYDGQATWDGQLMPSSNLGSTTVVQGNCGVGFAPCHNSDHQTLIEMMEGVEEIPGTALAEGLTWNWESFPEYLDALDAVPRSIDLAALLPHGPLRVYVMGERALNREAANAQDIDQMQQLLKEGLAAGAVGFSTSRTILHRSLHGEQIPTYKTATEELKQLGEMLDGDQGHVLQLISDWDDVDDEFSILRETAAKTNATSTFTLLILRGITPSGGTAEGLWRKLLDRTEQAQADGLNVRGQVSPRPVAIIMGHPASMSSFSFRPTFKKLASLPRDEMMAQLKDPAVKTQILSEENENPHVFMELMSDRYQNMYLLEDPLEYFPNQENNVAALAAQEGRDADEWLYDYFLGNDSQNMVYIPAANFAEDLIPDLLTHPHTVMGLGDGGAHVGSICDASLNVYLLTKWVKGDGKVDLPRAVRMITRDPAELYSLHDRGVIAEGKKADLNIIDMNSLKLHAPHVVHDLPAGGSRLLQDCDGIDSTIVAGELIYQNGQPTGTMPGKLVRGQRQA